MSEVGGTIRTVTPEPATALDPDIRDVAVEVLTALAGPNAQLREGQGEALDALTRPGARVLVVQATGWGKSAVYWIATAWSRRVGRGPTLVVSPLLSLMRDQVAAASRAGLRAATINSSNIEQWSSIEQQLGADELDLILVSPERLANPGFGARVMQSLAGRLGLVVIDEAHSVSDWGHDFRPDYRRVADILQRVHPDLPVLATTATANSRVVQDLATQFGAGTTVLRGPLARSSLELAVLPSMAPLQRYAWVVDHLPRLPGSGIIYTLTVADAERLTQALRTRYADRDDLIVAAYTGALEAGERERLEDALRAGQVKALVATSALGMGYDKPDLGFVVHVGAPPSPVSYYQQVGRAGRAIEHAPVALLPSAGDESVWEYFATATIPREPDVRQLLAALREASSPRSVPALEAETGLRRGKIELLLKQLAVDEVVSRGTDGWSATGKDWTFDAAHYEGVLAGRRREADIMRSYIAGEQCLMALLQESLDDPAAQPCGRCSVCTGRLPQGWVEQAEPGTVRDLAVVLRADQQLLEPRKMWPGGAFGARGRIPPALGAAVGRVLVHADAAEWGDLIAGPLRHDAVAPPELRDAAIAVLSGWKGDWSRRPDVIVGAPVAGHPELTASLATELAAVGRMEYLHWSVPCPDVKDLTSPDEAAAWRTAFAAGPPPAVDGRTVLLVVDASRSGWAVTVAAATLREAGAAAVLPLLIHRTV